MYAVVQTGGKQYRVAVGQSIQVEKLPQAAGESIEFGDVLLVADGDRVTAGTPLVAGARVVASVSRQERGPKILVFRYKSKKRVRVLRGHRQSLTRLFIRDIIVNGESAAERSRPATAIATEPTAAATEPTAVETEPTVLAESATGAGASTGESAASTDQTGATEGTEA